MCRTWYSVMVFNFILLPRLGTFNVNGFSAPSCTGTSLFLMLLKGERWLKGNLKVRGFIFDNIFWTYFFNNAIIENLKGSARATNRYFLHSFPSDGCHHQKGGECECMYTGFWWCQSIRKQDWFKKYSRLSKQRLL